MQNAVYPNNGQVQSLKHLLHEAFLPFLLRSELGFWDTLCREKMSVSKFLVQNDESEFIELVNASSLPCFTTDYIQNQENLYPNRVNILLLIQRQM